MRKIHCYFNGRFATLDKINISPYDLGFLRGYGVFDVMCTQNGKPFLFDEHWKRFQNSARELGLKIPVSRNEFKESVSKLLAKNEFEKSVVRTILTGGVSFDAMSPGKETFCILIEKFNSLPPSAYKKGVGIITLDYQREFPRAKTINYTAAIKAHNDKRKRKASEIIYVKGAKALEASTSNFFIFSANGGSASGGKKTILITPKKDILLGTTRNLVVKLARKSGYEVKERDVKIKELFSADEMFLTASNKGILPIIRVDSKKIGDGKIGEKTKKLMAILERFKNDY